MKFSVYLILTGSGILLLIKELKQLVIVKIPTKIVIEFYIIGLYFQEI